MDSKKLFDLYEKQYYHEIEARDKLNGRLQIPLAILVAVLGFLGFMLQNYSNEANGIAVWVFWALYLAASTATGFGVFFFRKSWFGHTDKLLPTAKQSEVYRLELIELYSSYQDANELVEAGMTKYLYDYYVEFSSINTINNDSRSYNLYLMTVAITIATVCSFAAFIPYQLNDLDKNGQLKPILVEIVKLPSQEELLMSTDNQPPPPPPPRSVKGEVPKPKPPPPTTSEKK